MKRVLLIIIVIIAAIGIVILGILLKGKGGETPTGPAGTLPTTGTLPITGTTPGGGQGTVPGTNGALPNQPGTGAGGAGVRAVTQSSVLDYAIGAGGVIFVAPNGAVVSASSSETTVAQASFEGLMQTSFSPDGKWLVVEHGDADSARWSLLDVNKKTWKDLALSTADMAWSPSGNQLAYFARRTNGTSLSIMTAATGAIRNLLTLAASDLTLAWQGTANLFLMDRPSAQVTGNMLNFNLKSGVMTSFMNNVSGAGIMWGGEASGGLLFRAGPTGGVLSLVDENGNVTQTASFLTLLSKCVFGESASTSTIANIADYLFCAVPQDKAGVRSYQLPDDYLRGKFGTIDTIYAVNLGTGILTPIIPETQVFAFDAEKLKVYGDSLYFVNRNNRKLYRAPLTAIQQPEQ